MSICNLKRPRLSDNHTANDESKRDNKICVPGKNICHIIAARKRQFALTTAKAMSHLQLSQTPASFHWLLQGGLLNVICSTVMAQASGPTG
jgi:hypothetical protein